MQAAVLEKIASPLILKDISIPKPAPSQVLIKVVACGLCRTDIHIVDGELTPKLPIIPGHQIVGTVESDSKLFRKGQIVGVPWLGKSCGECGYCKTDRENLCDDPEFTGYTLNGGFAEYCVADERFIFPIPKGYDPIQAAPLLCAGMIGYRSWRFARGTKKIGFYGFGAAAHLLIQVALYHKQEVFAFTRKGDFKTQEEAKKLGAVWSGDSETLPPEPLDGAIIFAPVGNLVPTALRAVCKGGQVICAGIHMSDIPSFPYSILWEEKMVRSVANLTRQDGREFLALAEKINIQTITTTYRLDQINDAIIDFKAGKIPGTAVIIP